MNNASSIVLWISKRISTTINRVEDIEILVNVIRDLISNLDNN
jgi:hypothetical protein